jgi:hypothetical protein
LVSERASKITEIIASTSYVQGDDANVVCKGLIGKDENEKKLGDIFLRIYWVWSSILYFKEKNMHFKIL